jgi:hypothetical protein
MAGAEVFAPAIVMGDKRPVAPDGAFFEKEALLVVVRITPPALEGNRALAPFFLTGSVGENDVRQMQFGYFYHEPEVKGDMLVKSVLLVAAQKDEVPADDGKIQFLPFPPRPPADSGGFFASDKAYYLSRWIWSLPR